MRREGSVLLCAAVLSVGVVTTAAADDLRIHDIQGSSRLSPHVGRQVVGVPGVVTAVRGFGSARGFWIQGRRLRTVIPPPARGCWSSPGR